MWNRTCKIRNRMRQMLPPILVRLLLLLLRLLRLRTAGTSVREWFEVIVRKRRNLRFQKSQVCLIGNIHIDI